MMLNTERFETEQRGYATLRRCATKQAAQWMRERGRKAGSRLKDATRFVPEMTVQEKSRPIAYFFSSTIRLWISVFPVFSTAIDSASRHHASPAFLVIVVVFPSDPVSLAVPGVIE
jgi:hypothetical protein